MTDETSARRRLVRLLRRAYSGERAAAFAYHGHWRSLRDPVERAAVRSIEQEEWEHRRLVGRMLAELHARPSPGREIRAWLVGRTLGPLCHVSGWVLPMLAAAWLERGNVDGYDAAAHLARLCGRAHFVPELRRMSEVEAEHERFFCGCVARHRLVGRLRFLSPGGGAAPGA